MLTLGFHRIEGFSGFEITRLSPRRFGRILSLIADVGSPVVPAGSPHGIALTFDDGMASVAEHALPRLADRGWPGAVFLVAGSVGKTDCWDVRVLGRARRMMTWAQVRRWSTQGVEFGSHSVTHADLTLLSLRALRDELRASKRIIEDETGLPVRWLSYPFGRHDQRVREEAAAAGYVGAFGTHPARDQAMDPFARPRVPINSLTSLLELRSLIGGSQQPSHLDPHWRGHWRNRFLSSLSAGSATVATWRRWQRRTGNGEVTTLRSGRLATPGE